MPIDRPGQPWSGTTYNGFSGASPRETGFAGASPRDPGPRAPSPPPRRSPPKRALLGGGIAVALAGGLFLGMLMRPGEEGSGDTPKAQAAAEAAAAAMPIEVARAATPAPAPVSGGKLEVLPPDMARDADSRPAYRSPAPQAPPPVARAATPAPVGTDVPAVARAPQAPMVFQPPEARPARPALEPRRAPPAPVLAEPRDRPSFNCRSARTPAERMICGDARLAQLDQRLDLAFRRAVSSGVPYRELRSDQDDWLGIREDAARYGDGAVANVYRQRIDELDRIADLGN